MNVDWTAVGTLAGFISAAVAWMEARNKGRNRDLQKDIELALMKYNDSLIMRLNGTYLKSDLASVQFSHLETQLKAMEARVAVIEQIQRDNE